MSFNDDHNQQQPKVTFSDIGKSLKEDFSPASIQSSSKKFNRGWGMLFRAVFIGAIAFIGYNWIDPRAIGDIPLSQLTLNDIIKPVFAIALGLGCLGWFFSFPETDEGYNGWAYFGYIVIGAFLVWALFFASK